MTTLLVPESKTFYQSLSGISWPRTVDKPRLRLRNLHVKARFYYLGINLNLTNNYV